MNLGIRAILYSARKWKKTLLVFFLLLSITTLVLSGLAIADAQEEQAREVRGTTGASFMVERNLSTGEWASENGGSYSTQEFISEEMIQEIAAVEGIAGYDASVGCLPQLRSAAGESLSLESFSFYAYGSFNSQYNSLFISGQLVLAEGIHITEDMADGILLSQECAEKNGLKLGDTVIGKIWDPNYDNPEVEMELAGIFDIVTDKENEANLYDDSSLWDFTEYAFCSNDATAAMAAEYSDGGGIEDAFFYVNDAAQLYNIIEEVQKISSINWNNYTITANDEVYQNISGALSDTGTLIITLIVVITAVSMVLITLILSMSIRSRKRETGILLAVGISKSAVILQYMLETLLIAAAAFPLACLSSRQMAGTLGTLFGKTAENVIVTPQHFMLAAIVGGILLIAAVLVSSISTLRLKPRQILSQME